MKRSHPSLPLPLFISSYGVAYTIYLLFIYGVVYRTPQKKKNMLSRLSSKSRDLLSCILCVVAFFRSVQNHDGGAMRSPSLLAGRVTLQARPTFCFSRKQFTAFCKEMTLLPMTTCLHIKGSLGKEQLLGSTSRPVPTHMATPSCIATLHQLN